MLSIRCRSFRPSMRREVAGWPTAPDLRSWLDARLCGQSIDVGNIDGELASGEFADDLEIVERIEFIWPRRQIRFRRAQPDRNFERPARGLPAGGDPSRRGARVRQPCGASRIPEADRLDQGSAANRCQKILHTPYDFGAGSGVCDEETEPSESAPPLQTQGLPPTACRRRFAFGSSRAARAGSR